MNNGESNTDTADGGGEMPLWEQDIIGFLEAGRTFFSKMINEETGGSEGGQPAVCSFVMRDASNREGAMVISPDDPFDVVLAILYSSKPTADDMRAYAERLLVEADNLQEAADPT